MFDKSQSSRDSAGNPFTIGTTTVAFVSGNVIVEIDTSSTKSAKKGDTLGALTLSQYALTHLAGLQARVDQDRAARAAGRRRPSPDGYQPRVSSRSFGSSVAVEMPTIGSPRPAETRASTSASMKCVVASTIARARFPGSPDLKIPEPTNTPSAPSCMQSAASAGVAIPPAVKVTTGSFPFSATQRTSSTGARSSFASA